MTYNCFVDDTSKYFSNGNVKLLTNSVILVCERTKPNVIS